MLEEFKKKYKDYIIDPTLKVQKVPTGLAHLDWVIGGGIPLGRIIELYGNPSSGKTTLSFLIGKIFVMKMNKPILYIDSEFSYDGLYVEKTFKINKDEIVVLQPESAEQVFEIIYNSAEDFSIIIIDSIASLRPLAENESDSSTQIIGLLSRILSTHLKKIVPKLSEVNVPLIAINQVRSTIGTYGNPETTPGGSALKFYSSLRLKTKRGQNLVLEDQTIIGNEIKVILEKTKVSSFKKERESSLIYFVYKGFDVVYSLCKFLEEYILVREGNSYYYKGEKLASSKGKLLELLNQNESLRNELYNESYKFISEVDGLT